VVGSSESVTAHLAITASPHKLGSYAKLVNGPGWTANTEIRPLGWLTIGGWLTRAVFVPPASNEGSLFAGHVALIWTVGDHTYGVGFHKYGSEDTVRLDERLLTHFSLVGP
jgi:hypothetical protein